MAGSALEFVQIGSALGAALLTARIITTLSDRIRWLQRNHLNGQRVAFAAARRADKTVMLVVLLILAGVGLVGWLLPGHDHAVWMTDHGRVHLWGDTAVAVMLAWKAIKETRALYGHESAPWDGIERRRTARPPKGPDGSSQP